jgi:hypothetical protein
VQKMIFISALLPSLSFAATGSYNIKSVLSINGKHIASANVVTNAGEQAMVTQKGEDGRETFIAVTPSEGQGQIKGRKAILMKFVVGIIENGERKVLGEPQIMTAENSTTEVSIAHPGEAKDAFSLSVIAEHE